MRGCRMRECCPMPRGTGATVPKKLRKACRVPIRMPARMLTTRLHSLANWQALKLQTSSKCRFLLACGGTPHATML